MLKTDLYSAIKSEDSEVALYGGAIHGAIRITHVLIVEWYTKLIQPTGSGLRLNTVKKRSNFVRKFAKLFIFIKVEDTRMRLGAEIKFHLDFCIAYYD